MKEVDEQAHVNAELLAIAQAFLARHEGEGVIDDQVLFCRAVRHLQSLDMPMHQGHIRADILQSGHLQERIVMRARLRKCLLCFQRVLRYIRRGCLSHASTFLGGRYEPYRVLYFSPAAIALL